MTLLYMYFENDSSDDKTYKGIKPNPKGYRFDNRFNIEFRKEEKTFYITDNSNYVKIYNDAISNFSCIVGRNGSGKTTFLELLLSNIVWGISPKQPTYMVSIYYKMKDDNPEFFLHGYLLNKKITQEYKIYYKIDKILQNKLTNFHSSYNRLTKNHEYTSTLPINTKYIFHSLSPFDKIFYSISLKLKGNAYSTSHYINQMNYIGVQNFIKDEPNHEIQTITNLIRLFANNYFKTPFIENLGYKFDEIKISINFREEYNESITYRNNSIKSKKLTDLLVNLILEIKDFTKHQELESFIKCEEKLRSKLIEKIYQNSTIFSSTKEEYIYNILLDNIDFNIFLDDIYEFENFLKYIDFISVIKDKEINFLLLRDNILNFKNFKNEIFIKDVQLLNTIESYNLEDFETILNLNSMSIEQISELKNLSNLIRLIRILKNKNYINFALFIKKEQQKINYFYLSSGEKTIISYFANLTYSMIEFHQIKNIENNTFIFFIDEVELHLHPKWQINFIEYINKFFRENNLKINFQFIIATHSPFILSDISEEQIIYINEEDKVENKFNTFGANIYDIFEKGFFLENSIGLCSQNFIKKISNEFHYFKALNDAKKHDDFFLLRSFKEENYIDFNNKKEEDEILLENELKNLKESIFNYKYIVNANNKYRLNENVEKAINIIGEPTIKNHLLGLYYTLKVIEINEN